LSTAFALSSDYLSQLTPVTGDPGGVSDKREKQVFRAEIVVTSAHRLSSGPL
jgi:hypothetical protein